MSLQLPKIYPITDRVISGLSHSDQVKALIAGGATLIQLREKGLAAGEWLNDAAEAVRIAKLAGVRVLINDRVDIALAVAADGVHLGQDDMPPEAARRLLGERAIIGYSTHTIDQVREALKLPVDYVAFGPIFPTATKIDPDPVVGLEQLREVKNELGGLPLVAIGGINAGNMRQCDRRRCGFSRDDRCDPFAFRRHFGKLATAHFEVLLNAVQNCLAKPAANSS